MGRPFVRLVAGIFVVLLLAVGAGGAFCWWKIAGLKDVLVRDLGRALGAKVEVASLDLDLWQGELHAAGISLSNERASAPWEKGEISQATVRFHLRDLWAPTLPLSVEVSSWSVSLHPQATAVPEASSAPPLPGSNAPVSESVASRQNIHVTQLTAHDGTAEIHLSGGKEVVLHGVAFEAGANGAGVWTTRLQATSIAAGSLAAGSSSVEIRGEPDKITFSNLRMSCGQGFLTGDGDVALGGGHEARLNLKAAEIPVTMLVAVEWQMKLSGLASGDLHYEGNDQAGSAQGKIAVGHAKFNVLPWLGKVTALVGLADISDVELDQATSDFAWKEQTLHLTNLDIRKNEVTRIAGEVEVDAKGQVDGKLKLGLPSTVTAKWPQLQEKVFPVQLEDYNWAEVRLTGTPDHLQEDLTPRLLAVGMGQGTDLLNQAAQKATDLFKNLMGN